MSTEYTLSFAEIGEGHREAVGGKGHSLARLAALEVNVPDGFVVTSGAYRRFLRENAIDTAAPEARERILSGCFPAAMEREIGARLGRLRGKYFAVRSSSISEDSADKSYAGMFESYLNVTPERLFAAIRDCFASTLAERVRCYRDHEEPIAVVVQEMVESRAAGVLFTCHPLTGDPEQIVIEACAGLGEPLVAGEITPDRYLLDKRTGTLLERERHTQGHKLVRVDGENHSLPLDGSELRLDTGHLRLLAALATRIEEASGCPCDIEWCIDETVRIVQSRPITTLPAAGSGHPPAPTYRKRFFSRILSPIFEEANVKGYWHYAQEQLELPFSLAGYHLYQPSVQHPAGEVDIWIDDTLDRRLDRFLRARLRQDITYPGRIEARYLAEVEAFTVFTELTEQTDFGPFSDGALIEWLERFDRLNQRMTSIYNAPIFLLGALGELLREEMMAVDPDEADADFIKLTLSCLQNPAQQREQDLDRLCLTARRALGWNAWSEAILDEPEIAALLDQLTRRWRFLGCTDVIGEAHGVEHFAAQFRERFAGEVEARQAEGARQMREECAELERVARKYPGLAYELTWMRRWLYHRNNTTEHYYRDFQCLKPLWLEVAGRLGVGYRTLLNLSSAEIVEALRGPSAAAILAEAERRASEGFTCMQQADGVLLKSGVEEGERIETQVLGSDEMPGQVANAGSARGPVKVIRDPAGESERFEEGDILVTSMTTPSFLPLMYRAAGIVTDEGGILCHAALVSREIGKPCLIAVANATQTLADGDRVELDCERGIVRVLERR
ncbi:PEP/pyruvate-binding domain-containing protein [Endothiovibrio diazotrophicus]